MSKAEGIYMSTDYRVTEERTGRLVDDAAIKFLTVHYPPMSSGPKALVAYTGVAMLPDGTPTGTWLRETLRGEDDTFDRSMTHLLGRLNRDIARLKGPLIVNILALRGPRRYAGGFTNVRLERGRVPVIRDRFSYGMQELKKPSVFANGSGAAQAAAKPHLAVLQAQLTVRPRRIHDHMKLLAAVNRRLAATESAVSPFCQVSFIGGDPGTAAKSEVFREKGEGVPFEMPLLAFGIDLTAMERRLYQQLESVRRGNPPPPEPGTATINEELRRRR